MDSCTRESLGHARLSLVLEHFWDVLGEFLENIEEILGELLGLGTLFGYEFGHCFERWLPARLCHS